jgi:hypothetical protein
MNETHETSWWRTPGGLALASSAVVVGFYLLMEHTAHALGALPYLLLLLCPLLHMFHHGGHHHRHHDESAPTAPRKLDGT